MIEKIIIDVSNELNNSTPSSDFDCLVGMDSHMKKLDSLLRLDLEEVRMIGIWGPSGIGKTTIARFIFERYSSNYQLSVFMKNIKGRCNAMPVCSDDYDVKLSLQEQFMSQITNHKDIKIPHLGIFEDRLKDKKVFVVLDDVNRLVQLQATAKEIGWFGPGSRIIVTTQDQKILKAHGINHIYKVDFPSSNEAFEMFCMYAFDQKFPKDGFTELAAEVTYIAGKLPLGLRVMGSYFRGMSKQEWEKALPRLRTCLDGEIESVLILSYDALYDDDKKLFLHIACFFNNEKVYIVEACLANSFSDVAQGLHVLVEKSLISIDEGWVRMHDLLVQLGRGIVRKQNVSKPRKRELLIDARDIDEMLNDDKTDSSRVIGITSLNRQDVTLTSETAFRRLSNLQFLYIYDKNITKDSLLDFISRKLRMLSWWYYPMPCLPSDINTQLLVKLYVPYSKLEKLWEGNQPLSNLRKMDLSYSRKLKKVHDLSTAANLLELYLNHCSSLVKIPSSIGNATNLQKLDLSFCSSLMKIPSSIWNAINLEELYLTSCSSLVEIPSFIRDLKLIKEVPPSSTRSLEIQELGPCIGRVSRLCWYSLSYLKASKCFSLERLNCSFCNPHILLEFDGCFKLNQETRDLIIPTRTNIYVVLPGGEVPECFTYRSSGSSLSVKSNQKRLGTSTKFKACILFDDNEDEGGWAYDVEVFCSITSKQNPLTFSRSKRKIEICYTDNLYIFEIEAAEVTSTELDFEFKLLYSNWEIKECGVFQLGDGDEDYETSNREATKD